MEFTVSRATWLRGEDNSMLLRKDGPNDEMFRYDKSLIADGKMCYLGFRALACGHTPEDIAGVSAPRGIRNIDLSKWRRDALVQIGLPRY
jgi:hypothetical protein